MLTSGCLVGGSAISEFTGWNTQLLMWYDLEVGAKGPSPSARLYPAMAAHADSVFVFGNIQTMREGEVGQVGLKSNAERARVSGGTDQASEMIYSDLFLFERAEKRWRELEGSSHVDGLGRMTYFGGLLYIFGGGLLTRAKSD
eukprot:2497397-Rhodomonas_salina.3